MSITHKLAMGPITLDVVDVEQTEGQFGPQVKFVGDGDVCVYVSLSSATAQLDRCRLTFDTAIGQRLYFEQIKKDGKTFTNISKASGGAAPAAAAAAPAARPAAQPMDVVALGAIYQQCVDQAMITIGNRLMESGTPFDGAVIQAAAATLFIKATR